MEKRKELQRRLRENWLPKWAHELLRAAQKYARASYGKRVALRREETEAFLRAHQRQTEAEAELRDAARRSPF